MARSYNKKSPYWAQPRKAQVLTQVVPPSISNIPAAIVQSPHMETEAAFDDLPHYSARAACGGGTVSNMLRDSVAPSSLGINSYPNIRSGIMPYAMSDGGYYGVSEVLQLTYQCYYNFALLRNCVKMLRDFSVSKIHIKTTNTRVKTFINEWFESIGLNQFMQQFFLEYYRSGNVFIYKFDGQIDESSTKKLRENFTSASKHFTDAKTVKVPIRYIILNPMQIYLQMGPTSQNGYVRMLSTYEIERLRNPQTPEDKQVLQSFPENIRNMIKKTGTFQYIYVPLDPKRLSPVFYDKMDYEPLAVPMAFPVLNDIEFKLELRRMDMALASTIERVILLVTSGRPADQFNQVPPKSTLQNLQDIFRNQTIGRVLVADYTTKAEWVIPDFKELLGPDKYQQVDKDIREGLQLLLAGEDKFANASVKVKIFIEGLKEGRRAFMENFLQPEVKKVCEAMGFRHVPDLEFEEIQMQDEALMARLYVQMAQLGLLTDDELNTALTTGMLPNKEESLKNQEEYKKERDKGLYTPLGGNGQPTQPNTKGRPGGTGGTPTNRKVSTPIGQKKVSKGEVSDSLIGSVDGDIDRSSGYRFGMIKIADNLMSMNALRAAVESALAKKWKIKGELGADEKSVAASLTQSIIFNEDEKNWNKSIQAYLKTPKELPEEVANELIDIRTTFDSPESPVDSWMAAILSRSKL